MQNLVKARTSLNSAHPEQLIARSFGAYGPRGRAITRFTFPVKSEQYFFKPVGNKQIQQQRNS
jgi:hypothetical protein